MAIRRPEPPQSVASLDDLRKLLTPPETEQRLHTVESTLVDPERHAEAVARVLPKAIGLRSEDHELEIALEPAVGRAVHEIVRREPEQFSEALFPIIGRAVRKAVSAAFEAILERVSEVVDHAISVRGLQYRMEAARTGRPLAEIVLSHTLLYRVEHVFLLHRPTGILLASASSKLSEVQQDPDAVAAMLSVIEGFVRETFAEHEPLTEFQVGELVGRIEYGPSAMLVAVVRGTAPLELEASLHEALERVQLQHRKELVGFRGGETAVFAATQPIIDACLVSKDRPRKRGPAPWVVMGVVLLAIMGGLSAWLWSAHRTNVRLNHLVDAFASEPGFVVTGSSHDGGHLTVNGLRDPIAREPSTVVAARGLDGSRVTTRFQPFSSADPRLIAKKLAPPKSVSLVVDGDEVHASGVAPRAWMQRTSLASGLLPGVSKVDLSDTREQESVDAFDAAKHEVDGAMLDFRAGKSSIDPKDAAHLDVLAANLKQLSANAAGAHVKPEVVIEGHADAAGTEAKNSALTNARAEIVKRELVDRGVPEALLTARAGARQERSAALSVTVKP